MNWFGALNNCLRKGLTLADLSNPRDFYGAVDFLSSKGNTEDFWFGGNDLQTEGRFQYASNGRLVRYYSNYSIVEPAMHSECDDCLEVRIRPNITVVADDNCMERQYFICSENYCYDGPAQKPRHHSHEHLHHFHHDIGVASDEIPDLGTPSPFDDVYDEEDGNPDSEEATLLNHGGDSKETGPGSKEETEEVEATTADEGSGGDETTAEPEEEEETTDGEGEGDDQDTEEPEEVEENTDEPEEVEETTDEPEEVEETEEPEGEGDGEETEAPEEVEETEAPEEETEAPEEATEGDGEGDGEESTAVPAEGGGEGPEIPEERESPPSNIQ